MSSTIPKAIYMLPKYIDAQMSQVPEGTVAWMLYDEDNFIVRVFPGSGPPHYAADCKPECVWKPLTLTSNVALPNVHTEEHPTEQKDEADNDEAGPV